MIDRIRFTWQLLVISSVLIILGLILIPRFHTGLSMNSYFITLAVVTGISLASYCAISIGTKKQGSVQMVYVLLGIGMKFLLYLLYILIYWLVIKKLEIPFIITFFILYLIFTAFLAVHLYKVLKNN